MKFCVIGVPGIAIGKHNLKDPRLDEADRLVEAKKKIYAQVDILPPEATLEADAIVVAHDQYADVILLDLEFIETRLGRDPLEAERKVLEKLRGLLESERTVASAGLNAEEMQAITAHGFHTNKPVVIAEPGELAEPEALMVRAFKASGHLCFLTVGGKENRAWPIKQGTTAWEAAGSVHTDIQKGFIRAEIISYDDFIAAGGETEAKRAGKQRLEMKQYVMQDCDLVNFRFNK